MAGPADPPDGDGSMETILASIRRIIREDESAAAQPPEPPTVPVEEEDELLVLEPSMMSKQPPEEARMTAGSHQAGAAQSAAALAAALFDDPEPPPPRLQPVVAAAPVAVAPAPESEPLSPHPTRSLLDEPEDDTLLAPQTRAATAQALAALQNAIRPEPAGTEMRVARSGGLTLEDIARDEVRGQLKAWLDANLPELVERVVRQEIERLVRLG